LQCEFGTPSFGGGGDSKGGIKVYASVFFLIGCPLRSLKLHGIAADANSL